MKSLMAQVHRYEGAGIDMDCGTCETASPIEITKPEIVNVQLTITENAVTMLEQAFGEDRSMGLLVAGLRTLRRVAIIAGFIQSW